MRFTASAFILCLILAYASCLPSLYLENRQGTTLSKRRWYKKDKDKDAPVPQQGVPFMGQALTILNNKKDPAPQLGSPEKTLADLRHKPGPHTCLPGIVRALWRAKEARPIKNVNAEDKVFRSRKTFRGQKIVIKEVVLNLNIISYYRDHYLRWHPASVKNELAALWAIEKLEAYAFDRARGRYYIVMPDLGINSFEIEPPLSKEEITRLMNEADQRYAIDYEMKRPHDPMNPRDTEYVFKKESGGEYIANPVGRWRFGHRIDGKAVPALEDDMPGLCYEEWNEYSLS
ncbi:hypothetical protein APHAL10511_003001 [Amanita phalloides]|nr:hypothetical protein APHAL10511_003001 [Amanita phalloides]